VEAANPSSSFAIPAHSAPTIKTVGWPLTNASASAAASTRPNTLDDHMWYDARRPNFVSSNVARDTWTVVRTTSGTPHPSNAAGTATHSAAAAET